MNNIAIYVSGNSETINNQLNSCLARISNDHKGKLINVTQFIDRGKRINGENVTLKKFIKDIKENKINKLYIDNISVFSKSLEETEVVLNTIFDSNCEVYLVDFPTPYTKKLFDLQKEFYNIEKKSIKTRIRHSMYNLKNSDSKVREILNVSVDIHQNHGENHENVHWYGGKVATIKASSGEYIIVARGQVRCKLFAKKDFIDETGNSYKEGELLAQVVDKNEAGIFYNEMSSFIKNDSELTDILWRNHDLYELEIGNNNWFELDFYNKDGELEYDYILDNSSLSGVIQEVKEIIWEESKNKIQYAIYTRLDCDKSDPEDSFNIQQDVCLIELNRKEKHNTDVIKVYKDYRSATKTLPALELLLKDIKDKKIKMAFTNSLSRLPRSIIKLQDINSVLKESGSDIFLVNENEYVYQDIFSKIALPEILEKLISNPKEINNNKELDEIEYE